MLFNNEADIVDNIMLGDELRQKIIIMGKQKTHFLGVVADRAYRILPGQKRVVHLQQAGPGCYRKRYLTVLIFFS